MTTSPEALVCYCFEYRRSDIEAELGTDGVTTIPDRIAARVKLGNCACETLNASGRSCLGDVRPAIREIRTALVGLAAVGLLIAGAAVREANAAVAEEAAPRQLSADAERVVAWMLYTTIHPGGSFLLAAAIATPGCEMRSLPHLWTLLTGQRCPVLGSSDSLRSRPRTCVKSIREADSRARTVPPPELPGTPHRS